MKFNDIVIGSLMVLLGLAGCDSEDLARNVPAKGNVNGLVVVPTANLLDTVPEECASLPIPGGYLPLADAKVTLMDANGSAARSQQTDTCGRFYMNADTSRLTSVSLEKSGYYTMESDIAYFKTSGADWGIVSTADHNNSFTIRVDTEGNTVTYNEESGNFKYTVIDTETGHAVLGLPQSSIALYKDSQEIVVTDYIFNNLHADIILSMDASGSMSSDVYDFNGTDLVIVGNRFDFAFDAAKQFINGLSGNAKVGINIFDNDIDSINQNFMNGMGFSDINGSVKIGYATDGFESNKKLSKFVIDLYNYKSKIYGGSVAAEFPYTATKNYKWGGLTALYDVAYKSVEKLSPRGDKKIAVLMTDGYDTVRDTKRDFNDTIALAQKNDVAFYTIAVGGDIDGAELKYLADQTGGIFIRAEGADLSDKFEEILSEIQYNYEVGGNIDTNATAVYKVEVNIGGSTISGQIEHDPSLY